MVLCQKDADGMEQSDLDLHCSPRPAHPKTWDHYGNASKDANRMANSVDIDQTAPLFCGDKLFASFSSHCKTELIFFLPKHCKIES